MSIPLDRLYRYINNVANKIYGDSTVIIRFDPPGSKKLKDLTFLVDPHIDKIARLHIYCHDQEPLEYAAMSHARSELELDSFQILRNSVTLLTTDPFPNLRWYGNIHDLALLLHSEKRSSNLQQYQDNTFIPVYHWSHAIIALDWFRYAEHIQQRKQVTKTFLVYNRAWSGTREYRLKFLDLVLRLGLEDHCQASVSPIEPDLGIHYETHKFKNPCWRPTQVLENFFPANTAPSHSSADFDLNDYEATDIEVVLETLFDDSRLHLTEKALRPIACAQPFILAGTHGSLEYLRSYGFKTFGDIWNEHYDLVDDPEERLIQIVDLMKQIANWAPQVRKRKMAEAQVIADYNRQHFFSKEFFNLVVTELQTNLTSAFDIFNAENTCQLWIDRWKILLSNQEILTFLKNGLGPFSLEDINYLTRTAEQKLNPVK